MAIVSTMCKTMNPCTNPAAFIHTTQKIFQRSGKVNAAVFHGHTHQDTHEQIEGIHYLTQLGMVDHSGPENNAYAVVEVYGDGRMEVIGYRRVQPKSMT